MYKRNEIFRLLEAKRSTMSLTFCMCRWIFIMAEPVRGSSSIEFLTHVFNRRSVEKDRSHDATVTGYVTKTLKSLKLICHIEICADWLHQSRTGSFRMILELELSISRSLLQACRNNSYFNTRILTNWNKKFVLIFLQFFTFYSFYFPFFMT